MTEAWRWSGGGCPLRGARRGLRRSPTAARKACLGNSRYLKPDSRQEGLPFNPPLPSTKALAWILVCLILTASALAIGISPIRKVVDFEPGAQELSVTISNQQERAIKAVVYARGDLAQYIGIKDSLLTVQPGGQAQAGYVLTLPESFDRPGVHKGEIVAMEYPESFGTGKQSVVSASASVVSELWVRVPYPGKYAEGALHIESKNVGENVQFIVTLMNFGKEDIRSARATIKILGATYEQIAEFQTDEIALKPQEQKQMSGTWLANVNPGKYHAVAEIAYDEKKAVLEQDFEVGRLFIAVKAIDVRDFSLGEVAVMDITLKSEWNEPISGVYGEITVLDKQGTTFGTFKTASTDLAPMGEGTLKAYWDTNGLNVGSYTLRLLVHYGERVTERLVETEVSIDGIRTSLGPTAQVIAQKGASRETLLTILVILLIVINVVWFVFFMRKRK